MKLPLLVQSEISWHFWIYCCEICYIYSGSPENKPKIFGDPDSPSSPIIMPKFQSVQYFGKINISPDLLYITVVCKFFGLRLRYLFTNPKRKNYWDTWCIVQRIDVLKHRSCLVCELCHLVLDVTSYPLKKILHCLFQCCGWRFFSRQWCEVKPYDKKILLRVKLWIPHSELEYNLFYFQFNIFLRKILFYSVVLFQL